MRIYGVLILFNANDILHTLANNITGSTLSPGSASNAGASAKGQELNAYSKAMKIISDNATYINSKSGTDTAAGDLIEEIFFLPLILIVLTYSFESLHCT